MAGDAQRFSYPRPLIYLLMFSAPLIVVWPLFHRSPKDMTVLQLLLSSCWLLSGALYSVYLWRYAIVVDGNNLYIDGFSRKRYIISDITAINMLSSKSGRQANILFRYGMKITIYNQLSRFDELIELLKEKSGIAKPISELYASAFDPEQPLQRKQLT
jgi:hypothetical protein